MELVINKKEFYIPNKWNEVSLRKYMQFMATYNEELSEAEKQMHLITCFTGANPDHIGKASKSVINKAVKRLGGLMETKPSEELVIEFEIDGVEYGFHPNMRDLKLKEFVDLDNALGNGWENMHKIMGILYRPITNRKGDKYDIEDYDFITANNRANMYLDSLSVEVVNGAAAFFLGIVTDYMKIMRAYSQVDRKTRRERTRQTKKLLRRTMDGTL
tara:strand:- start:51 stop:698 length:648 start_codon:yes stop_codon:yes gene_type:complete